MMANREFTILTEVTCDLPQHYLKKTGIRALPMNYTLDGTEYDGGIETPQAMHLFYEKLRRGIMAKTSAVSREQFRKIFSEELDAGRDILYLGFSSGLSSSCESACVVAEEMRTKYPDAQIICVDSLCASLGQGLFVDYVARRRREGLSIEDCKKAAEDIRQNICHYFTVDDLNHLYRGGRVSKTAAIFGTMLGIKPVMHVDKEGHLIPHGKVRGRKQSLDALVSSMGGKISDSYENPYVFISHGDCEGDAKYVAEQVKLRFGIRCEVMNTVGTVIGTHSGPGTVALFFIGDNREEKRL